MLVTGALNVTWVTGAPRGSVAAAVLLTVIQADAVIVPAVRAEALIIRNRSPVLMPLTLPASHTKSAVSPSTDWFNGTTSATITSGASTVVGWLSSNTWGGWPG